MVNIRKQLSGITPQDVVACLLGKSKSVFYQLERFSINLIGCLPTFEQLVEAGLFIVITLNKFKRGSLVTRHLQVPTQSVTPT